MRLTAGNEHQDIINRLFQSGRLYWNQKFHLFQHLTTSVLICKQDAPNSWRNSVSGNVQSKIDYAIKFSGIVVDYDNFNALSHIQLPGWTGDVNLTAFFLFMADEVSRNPNDTGLTFLSACRKVGLTLHTGDTNFTSAGLKEKLVEALKLLKIYHLPHIQKAVEDWHTKGSFDVCGITHSKDADPEVAHYIKIAQLLKNKDKNAYVNLSDAISLALGNRDFIRETMSKMPELDEQQAVFQRAKILAANPEMLYKVVRNGDEERGKRIMKKISQFFDGWKYEEMPQSGTQYFNNLLSGMPLEALRILDATNYSVAYLNEPSLVNSYPDQDLPGFTHEDCEISRGSRGLNLSGFKLIMGAKGNSGVDDPYIQQQTILHEIVHVAFSRLTLSNFPDLRKEVDEFLNRSAATLTALQNTTHPALSAWSMIYTNRTVKDVLNPNGKLDNYSEEERKEEVIANMYALMNTIFRPDQYKGNNPFYSDIPELAPLRQVCSELTSLIDKISNRLMGRDLPDLSQGFPRH